MREASAQVANHCPLLLALEVGEDTGARRTTGTGEEKQEKIFILG
jgi:hypothetical protein